MVANQRYNQLAYHEHCKESFEAISVKQCSKREPGAAVDETSPDTSCTCEHGIADWWMWLFVLAIYLERIHEKGAEHASKRQEKNELPESYRVDAEADAFDHLIV